MQNFVQRNFYLKSHQRTGGDCFRMHSLSLIVNITFWVPFVQFWKGELFFVQCLAVTLDHCPVRRSRFSLSFEHVSSSLRGALKRGPKNLNHTYKHTRIQLFIHTHIFFTNEWLTYIYRYLDKMLRLVIQSPKAKNVYKIAQSWAKNIFPSF